MNPYKFIARPATQSDIPFLVETIIEAEKSGTGQLSYSTLFGISEPEARNYIRSMLLEEVDGCELSVSSFIVIEDKGKIAAASAAWIEGIEGIPSSVLKGNLLNYVLPKECMNNALTLNRLIRELHIEYFSNTFQLGLVYVSPDYRGLNLTQMLIEEQINRLHRIRPIINEMYLQVFANNIQAIKAYEKANFKVDMVKESSSMEIINYLPSNSKILMKKEINVNNL